MDYTISQLKAGLSDAKAEYKIAKTLFAKIPSDENLHYCKTTYARIGRVNAMINSQGA